MDITGIDHLVLTVRDIDASVAFYVGVLGMEAREFEPGRIALHFGRQKIHLHPHPSPIDSKAAAPVPGSADLCFVSETPIDAVLRHLEAHDQVVEIGPVARIGAVGPMTSVYLRDPDGNLVEIAAY